MVALIRRTPGSTERGIFIIVADTAVYGENGRKKAVSIMIQAIYGLVTKETEENGENK